MSGLHDQPDDATPLTAEERAGLIPAHVALRRELNELEQQNILTATGWAFQRRRNPLDETFAKGLHRRMFAGVWRWAGQYRTSEKNIGCMPWQIQTELHRVFGNTAFQMSSATFGQDEIAARFHHGIVLVHPFANGNGRWSRLMADLLLVRMGAKPFGWGNSTLRRADETRRA